MNIEPLINGIDDPSTLEKIINLARQRLEQIETDKRVDIILRKGHWYAVQHLNCPQKRRAMDLGKRLTAKEVWARSQIKPPSALDYEIPKEQAMELRKTKPEEVGWVEIDIGNGVKPVHRYYLVSEYTPVKLAWNEWKKLASHPLAMSYGLTVEGMSEIIKLQDRGYCVVFSE